MIAEVIAIGDELTSGQRLDTNSQWLSQQLGELGIRVLYHSTVGDDLAANIEIFRHATARAGIVMATGGLGPTADDLTRQSLAAAAGVDLVQDAGALQHIRDLFARRRREMPERNVVQAMFPRGSAVIPNPHGTAPGIYQTFAHPDDRKPCQLFALPGVPAEMREMWWATVRPQLIDWLGVERRMIRHRRVKCFGVGESDLEQMLPDLIQRGRQPSVGITVSQATITLRITAEGTDETECDALIQPTLSTIGNCLGDLVFGDEDDELQHAVVRKLSERKQTLATFESGPGGLLAHWLSEVDPAGAVYLGGAIARNHDALQRWLPDESAADMVVAAASRARDTFGADYALAIGPFPRDATADPVVRLALATDDQLFSRDVGFSGHPEILTARCAKQALNLLRLAIPLS